MCFSSYIIIKYALSINLTVIAGYCYHLHPVYYVCLLNDDLHFQTAHNSIGHSIIEVPSFKKPSLAHKIVTSNFQLYFENYA